MDIFENADSSLRFQKIRVPTYRIRIVFARLHENAKPMDMRLNSLRDMRCIMYDIEKPAFSKISTPRIVFENLRFGAQKRRLLVDGRLQRRKKISFQKYLHSCERGPEKYLEHKTNMYCYQQEFFSLLKSLS